MIWKVLIELVFFSLTTILLGFFCHQYSSVMGYVKRPKSELLGMVALIFGLWAGLNSLLVWLLFG